MVLLGYFIIFVLGGTAGFALASLISTAAESRLIWDNPQLQRNLNNYGISPEMASKESQGHCPYIHPGEVAPYSRHC